MKRFFSASLLLVLAFAIPQASSLVIQKSNLPNGVIIPSDTYAVNLEDHFDLRMAKFPLSVETNIGEAYDSDSVFASIVEEGTHKHLNFVEQIDENLFVIVHDETKVTFQYVNFDGKGLGRQLHYDFLRIGLKLHCTGFALNKKRNLVYVGCSQLVEQSATDQLTIFTYDLAQEEVVSTVTVDQEKDGFQIKNRLQLWIGDFDDETQVNPYLIAYDQGHSTDPKKSSAQAFRKFFGVKSGNLKEDSLINIKDSTGQKDLFVILYDVFHYEQSVVVVGKTEVSGTIQIAQCKISDTGSATEEALCGNLKDSGIDNGRVQVTHKHVFVLDFDQQVFLSYKTKGKFAGADWLVQEYGLKNFNVKKDTELAWARRISANNYGIVVNWVKDNRMEDFGSTVHDFSSHNNRLDETVATAMYGRTLLRSINTSGTRVAALSRLTAGFLMVDGSKVPQGLHEVAITVTDALGSKAVAMGALEVTKNVLGRVAIKNSIGHIELSKDNAFAQLNLNDDDVLFGNGLNQVSVKFGLDTVPVNSILVKDGPIVLDFDDFKQGVKPYKVFLSDKFVAALYSIDEGNDSLRLYSCSPFKINSNFKCAKVADATVSARFQFHANFYSSKAGLAVLAYYDPQQDQSGIIAINDQGVSKTAAVAGGFSNFELFDTNDDFVFATVALEDKIVAHAINKNSLEIAANSSTIDAASLELDELCVRDISRPTSGEFVVDILNTCTTGQSSIYRAEVATGLRVATLPLSSDKQVTSVCSFGNEIVLGTNTEIFSINMDEDFNYWSTPISEFNIANDEPKIFCANRAGRFLVSGAGDDGSHNAVEVRADSPMMQGRRYPVWWQNYEGTAIYSYEFYGKMVTVMDEKDENTGHLFMRGLDVPQVTLTITGDVVKSADVLAELTIGNGQAKQLFYQNVRLVA